jgi:hypothetical protein
MLINQKGIGFASYLTCATGVAKAGVNLCKFYRWENKNGIKLAIVNTFPAISAFGNMDGRNLLGHRGFVFYGCLRKEEDIVGLLHITIYKKNIIRILLTDKTIQVGGNACFSGASFPTGNGNFVRHGLRLMITIIGRE